MKIKKLVDSFNNAIDGLIHSLKTQRNMRIHFIAAILVLILAGVTHLSRIETVVLFLTISLVIAAELINTAIEAAVDLACSDYHPLAKIAKNVAAGAVLVTAINAVIVGYLIFHDKLSDISLATIKRIPELPIHVTAISLVAVTLIVIVVKALTDKGTFLRGGMPSGHSALSASLLTSIILLSGDVTIAILASVLTLIVMHSRLEAKVHTLWEILAGATLGFIITIFLFQLFRI
ncbi:MAG: diacylglycerol kinase [Eubacteriales bacterium]|jgi:diacylglycerol kinase (ATP)|nr:diacylglycerol kinase [Clostridia bacterium]